jgi:hypothetical protein
MPSQKKDFSVLLSVIAVALAAAALITVIVREADDVKFVPRDEITTTTIMVTLPEGG